MLLDGAMTTTWYECIPSTGAGEHQIYLGVLAGDESVLFRKSAGQTPPGC